MKLAELCAHDLHWTDLENRFWSQPKNRCWEFFPVYSNDNWLIANCDPTAAELCRENWDMLRHAVLTRLYDTSCFNSQLFFPIFPLGCAENEDMGIQLILLCSFFRGQACGWNANTSAPPRRKMDYPHTQRPSSLFWHDKWLVGVNIILARL